MADRLYTSQATDEIISAIRANTKLDKATIAKLAFSYSISTTGSTVSRSNNFSGGEMKRATFIGNDELLIKTLLSQVHKKEEIEEAELYSNKSLVKDHIDNGSALLWELFQKNGEDVNRWYEELISTIEIEGSAKTKTKDLDVFICRSILNNE